MKRRFVVMVTAAVCFTAQGGRLRGPVPLVACGPFPPQYAFARAVIPDAPRYEEGQLGIVQPSFERRYLFVAWRYLNGVALTGIERKAVALPSLSGGYVSPSAPRPGEAVERWRAARGALTAVGPAATIGQWKTAPGDAYPYYLNCPDAAFNSAADTLALLIKQFGAASALTHEWVVAQDEVFRRCAGEAAAESPIRELAADAPAFARAERAYQIAAGAFYAGEWDAAERRFRAIASDSTSRWRPWARYLAGRTLVRKATLTVGANTPFDPAILRAAEAELTAVVGEASDQKVRTAAEGTLRFVRLRTEPVVTLTAISQRLQHPRDSGPIQQDLDEYRYLLDVAVGNTIDFSFDAVESLRLLNARDEMTDWILTYQSSGDGALRHALERWRITRAPNWLMAVAIKLDGRHQAAPEVLDAIASAPQQSPSFATLAFHRARLLIEAGRLVEARTSLDAVLGRASRWPPSTTNSFKAARLRTARSLAEFMNDAVRARVVAGGWSGRERIGAPGFDTDSTDVMNERMPLALLASAAAMPNLPAPLRRQIAIAAFTRAVMIGDDDRIAALARLLSGLAPELKEPLTPVVAASSPEARRHEAWFTILRHPGLRPFVPRHEAQASRLNQLDMLRDHWWCTFASPPMQSVPKADGYQPPRVSPYEPEIVRYWRDPQFLRPLYPKSQVPESPAFLTSAQRAQAQREYAALERRDAAATTLARQAVAFARANASDPRAPEALYFGVRATRYGCTDDDTGKASKAAFDLLHQQYGQTAWAKRAPYWYR